MTRKSKDGASAPPFVIGLMRRCPRCGKGKLFTGLLDVREVRGHWELDRTAHDSDDGPAVLVILLVGGLAVILILYRGNTFRTTRMGAPDPSNPMAQFAIRMRFELSI